MIVFGLLLMLTSAGTGTFVAWQTRHVIVRLDLGPITWTGHLYALLVLGALLACWFMLGAAFVQCRIAELRRARADTRPALRTAREVAPAGPLTH